MTTRSDAPNLPRLLTVKEVSQATGLPRWRLYQLIQAGEIPHLRIRNTYRFAEGALVRWIEERQAQAPEEDPITRERQDEPQPQEQESV